MVGVGEPAPPTAGALSMSDAIMIGLNIAKYVLQVHNIDKTGEVVVRRQMRRGEVMAFFVALPPCLVGMEACATALSAPGRSRRTGITCG